jgi:di/tricarboxylate transporter
MYFPDLPNPHALAALAMTVLALILFTREKIPLESSSLFVLVALIIGFGVFPYEGPLGELKPSEFFQGFGHEALVAVCALMVAGQALVRTGALEPVARRLSRFWKRAPALALLATLVVGAVLSAFMNNTPIVVLMLPMLIGAAMRSHSSTSGILLPMGLATIIGGMSTTIGTSTNLLVVSVAADMGMERLQMFDFLLPAVMAGSLAVLYLWLAAPRLIPERQPPMIEGSNRVFNAQLLIPPGNSLVGKNLADVIRKAGGEVNIQRIGRGQDHFLTPLPDLRIEAFDRLLVADTVDRLREFAALLHAQLLADEAAAEPLPPAGEQLVEVAVTLGSSLRGVRLGDAQLKQRHGVDILALHCADGALPFETPGINQRKLKASDVLLVQGDAWEIARMKTGSELLVLDGKADLPRTRKAPLALAIMIGIVALAAFRVLPIETSALLGAMLLIVTGCLTWRDATNALSVQVILIIVASLALGFALMRTGGADWLAQVFLAVTFGAPPWLVLSALMLLMAILTNIVSNNAAAVIGTPIAISIAMELGMPLEPFVLAVLFGANLSFATPMAYKTNLLVMNAGGYHFNDFVRVGIPLTLLMWAALSVILTLAYGLLGK